MATGGHRGTFYREERRGSEFRNEETRKREYHHLDRCRNGDRDRSWGLDSNGVGESSKMLNGSDCHGSSAANAGRNEQKRRHFSEPLAHREAGELPSGSSSEDRDVLLVHGVGNGHSGSENDCLVSPPPKRRKFSPIVWDRDDEQQMSATVQDRSRKEAAATAKLSTSKPSVEQGFDSLHVNSRSVDLPCMQQPETPREPRLIEDDKHENSIARDISSSRWAIGNDASDDDGYERKVECKRKSVSPLHSANKRVSKEMPTPELGEIITGEGFGNLAKSSDSYADNGGEYKEPAVDPKDSMDVDRDEVGPYNSDCMSDTDSEAEDCETRTPEPVQPPQRCINMLQGCRSVNEFERLNKIDEGTYGVVYRAKDKKTGGVVALKKVKMEREREGFPLTSLREINILLSFHHPSIVDVKEVVVGCSLDSIFMVMEYMEHDLKGLMETMKQPFSQSEVKCLMLQLLEGMKYLHDNWVLHRDLKTSNLLLNNRGELKICDFGLARRYGSPLKPYTRLVVTLWYRAPELLLGARQYSTGIDMWSLGCIMAELLRKEPLFDGKTELEQLDKIFRMLGTPSERIWPGFSKLPGVKVNFVKQPFNKLKEKFRPASFTGSPILSEAGLDLLNKLLTYDPQKRITAEDALNHDWFREVPLPKSKDFMPTFPAQHAQDRRLTRVMKSPDPLEELQMRELHQGNLRTCGLFG